MDTTSSADTGAWLDSILYDENGLVPAIAQEVLTNKVVMFAFMNRE